MEFGSLVTKNPNVSMDFGPFMPKKFHIGMNCGSLMTKKRKQIMLREIFVHQNGALLMEDKLKSGFGSIKVFRAEELEKATMNYAENMIIGRGGNGVVYKGVLPDNRVVAIKRYKRSNQEVQPFINEITILGQISHRNVIQLLGCCLETEVPLLVYEYVPNYDLYHHMHYNTSSKGRLSWNSRLRIAHESAGALAYLHLDASVTIIHRDVKSANILLDANYTAKVADFGASKSVPMGDDKVPSLVFGTLGYLDPEYFHTSVLTSKSDVYSFGVVLAELLTGLKPVDSERGKEDANLATYFVKAKMENRLRDIVDRQVLEKATDEQLKAACSLVCRCLHLRGENRPSMKEVTMEIERIRKLSIHPRSSQDNYDDMSSLVSESEQVDLYDIPHSTDSETFNR